MCTYTYTYTSMHTQANTTILSVLCVTQKVRYFVKIYSFNGNDNEYFRNSHYDSFDCTS